MTQRRRSSAADFTTTKLKPGHATTRANGLPGIGTSSGAVVHLSLRATARRSRLSHKQLEVLQQWDSDELLANRNRTIEALGHGHLRTARGDYLDIGGSTGGGSRRIIDAWEPPDWHHFLLAE